jgi:hypothetical protein
VGDVGRCFICGAPTQSSEEPRTCVDCDEKLRELTAEQRKKLFEIFEKIPENRGQA